MRSMKMSGWAALPLVVIPALALALTFAGCGKSSGSDETSKFEGAWTFSSGSIGGTCLSMQLTDDLTGSSLTVTKGTSSDLLIGFQGCEVQFQVSGASASAVPNQTCMVATGNSTLPMATVSITSWTITTSDGRSLTTSMMGTVLGDCAVTGSGAATKATAQDASAGS
jgi:hypothetical protein